MRIQVFMAGKKINYINTNSALFAICGKLVKIVKKCLLESCQTWYSGCPYRIDVPN